MQLKISHYPANSEVLYFTTSLDQHHNHKYHSHHYQTIEVFAITL